MRINIQAKDFGEPNFNVEIEDNATVAKLEIVVCVDRPKISLEDALFYYNDKKLRPHERLNDIGIKEGHSIRIRRRIRDCCFIF